MPLVMDSDTHLYETRNLWADYADPGQRGKTVRVADDDLGHAWLMFGDRRISLAEVHHPGQVDRMGEYRLQVRKGVPAEASYDELLPRAFWDPVARVADLDRFGIDETVVFPNFGLLWERPLEDDLEATKVNMAAWNRWTVDMAAAGKGRLHPVAHLSLRDLDWLDRQLTALEAGGARPADGGPPPLGRLGADVPADARRRLRLHERFNGEPLTKMELKPSEYVERHVRVAAFGYERPDRLIRQAGDPFMFCSDFPHAEGLAQPLDDYM